MNAREMFEALGYEEQFKGSDIYINRKYGSRIAFDDYNGGTIDVVELCYIPRELLKAINIRCQELGWLEEEKTEIKEARNPEVTNLEYYKDEILKCCIDDLAVVKGIPKLCSKTDCNDCDFLTIKKDCHEIAKDWLKQPYKKLTYKLNEFEFDLIQTYLDCHESCKFSEFKQLIELKNKGYFNDVDKNELIKDIIENCEVV